MVQKKQTKRITAWSYSRYADYKQCPLKAKLKHIDKIQEPPNAAMARGGELGKKIEAYIKGQLAKLPPEFKPVAAKAKLLREKFKKKLLPVVVEDSWAMTREWARTVWNDWDNCWLRVKVDAAYHEDEETLDLTDWKSGKFRQEMNDDYVEQLELYALSALVLMPHLKKVRVCLEYFDQGLTYPPKDKPMEFTQADVPKLKKLWEKRVKPMMADTKFAPRPNDKCCWCFYGQSGKAKGGPGLCKF